MNQSELIKSLLLSDTNAISILDIFLSITIPFILCLLVALFYKKTSRNNLYTISFIYSMPLFGLLSSIITLLIGNNIARAFGLVGALSLIRFRTALKEPLESIYLFWCLAIGMACGTGFYLAALFIVILGILYMSLLYKFKFAVSSQVYVILKVHFAETVKENIVRDFEKFCKKLFGDFLPLNMHLNQQSSDRLFVYSCKLKSRILDDSLVDSLKSQQGIENVEIIHQDSALYI